MTKIRRNWFPLTLAGCLAVLLASIIAVFAQVSPQIQGAGPPSNPCNNGGQDYVDQTNHVLYTCPSSGSNWVNRGLGNGTTSGLTQNGVGITATLPTVTLDSTYGANPGVNLNLAGANRAAVGLATTSGGWSNDSLVGDLVIRVQGSSYIRFAPNGSSAGANFAVGPSSDYVEVPLVAAGTAAGISGTGACASTSGLVAGSWAGKVQCTGTTGASTLVITPGFTTTGGYQCDASDTTTANTLRQSAFNTTTCTIAGTVNANDVLTFKATAF